MSPSITSYELAALDRKREQPTREPGELLAIFVSGRLKNPLNGNQFGSSGFGRTRYRQQWKERVALVILETMRVIEWGELAELRARPKVVTFLASLWSPMDSDGLQAAVKPVRDALVECGMLSGDAERDGNRFEYAQQVDRGRRGVEVRVRLL